MTVGIVRRKLDPVDELRSLQDLSHRVWVHDPTLLNFEASFGTLAWERGGRGRCRAFVRDDRLVGWARLVPGYRRIRRSGVWDDAPASLVWQVDPLDDDPGTLLTAILTWAEERAGEPFTTAYNDGNQMAEAVLTRRGYVHDPTEPYSGYLSRSLGDLGPPPELAGYRFLSMAELGDVDQRAEVHRQAWDGSTRSADDVRLTMSTWPYEPEVDIVAVTDSGALASSALCWFDPTYTYGEIEPVGTVPAHRGVGVGAALLRFALTRLRDAGAAHAVVGARSDDDYPAPRRLYRSVGFDDIAVQAIVRSPA